MESREITIKKERQFGQGRNIFLIILRIISRACDVNRLLRCKMDPDLRQKEREREEGERKLR